LLVDGISQSGALAGTVLDVGSGFGDLTLALLERGASSAIAVDASAAYVGAARDEAHRQGRSDAIRFVHADFVVAASELPSTSIVTLDRVVCCYPSCQQLLDAAVARTERCLALSYPRDVWYVRAGMALENGHADWLRPIRGAQLKTRIGEGGLCSGQRPSLRTSRVNGLVVAARFQGDRKVIDRVKSQLRHGLSER
jgi:SAM-dependent methyltransferase